MEFLIENHSSFPCSAAAAGAVPVEDLLTARAQIDEVVHVQERAGLDIVTDGQVRWPDPVSYVMGALEGVRLDGPVPYLGTERSMRQPVITAAVRRRAAVVCGDFVVARHAAWMRVKPVLPGPYTLARLSRIESGPYRDVTELAHALSEVLALEVRDLVAAGAQLIQIEEPALLSHPEDVRLVRQVLEPLWAARGSAQLMLATYFGDAEPLYAQLNSVPADVVAFDLASSKQLAAVIADTGASKILALGVVDGRSAQLESPKALARQIEAMLRRYTLDTVHLQPSCGMHYLSPETARAKLDLLGDVRAMLQ
jgi:5-methyltetrahydropteroyltriglutamate--homocysteine methyltransferase